MKKNKSKSENVKKKKKTHNEVSPHTGQNGHHQKVYKTINAGEGVEKRGLEPSYTVSGNANWYSHYGEQCGGSLNLLNRTAIRPSKPTAGQTH